MKITIVMRIIVIEIKHIHLEAICKTLDRIE